MRRPSRTALTIEPKSSSSKHDRGRLARHVRSASAHGNADVRRLERGRIVDAVSGHGHDLAARLERVDDTELLLRHDPREHGRGTYAPSQLCFAQLLELFAGHEVFGVEARLTGDCSGGRRVVAGDHDHLDAGRPAFAHRIGHARPQRIGKADEAQELEREIVLRVRPWLPREGGAGDAQHAQALGGHGVHGLRQRGEIRGAEVAKIGDGFRCALGRDDELSSAIGSLPDVRHGEEIGAKPVSVHERPFRPVQMFGLGQLLATEIMKRLLHRVEGIARTGEKAELDQVMEVLRHVAPDASRGRKTSPLLSRSSAMDMRFSVSVPVLSVHSTVAEPRVSMAAARRVSTRAREIRQAPIAMNTVSTTGNSSGSIDMPSAMPASTASSHPPRKVP